MNNGFRLLALIRTVCNGFVQHHHVGVASDTLVGQFYAIKIQSGETLNDFHRRFTEVTTTMEASNVRLVLPVVAEHFAAAANPVRATPNGADNDAAWEMTKAVRFMSACVGVAHFETYVNDLHRNFQMGHDDYPSTVAVAMMRMANYEPPAVRTRLRNNRGRGNGGGRRGTNERTFTQDGNTDPVPGANGVLRTDTQCHRCNRYGHAQRYCPNNDQGGNTARLFVSDSAIALAQSKTIPSSWILLDNQSTVDVFCNGGLLSEIHNVSTGVWIHCNSGRLWTNQVGTLLGYGPVWYCPKAIANILSLHNVQRRWRVTFDSGSDNVFRVHKEHGEVDVYRSCDRGLHYLDTASTAAATVTEAKTGNGKMETTLVINTVDDNKENYTPAEVQRAKLARVLQNTVGNMTSKELIWHLNRNHLPNCTVTAKDVRVADDIWGPDVGSLKGRTTRNKSIVVPDLRGHSLPPAVLERYKDITLAVDVFFVNGVGMLLAVSLHLLHTSVVGLKNRDKGTIAAGLDQIAKQYRKARFQVKFILMDGEGRDGVEDLLSCDATVNVTMRDEHVGVAERRIRVVKERMRSYIAHSKFERWPIVMISKLAEFVVFWLNAFPVDRGISRLLSPYTIMTGLTVNYSVHCRFVFGEYVQTHEEHDNSMAPRTIGAIALGPAGNVQGGYEFMSLSTGRVIRRNTATKIPATDEVFAAVDRIARRQRMNVGITLTDMYGNQTTHDYEDNDSDDDSDYQYEDGDDDDVDLDLGFDQADEQPREADDAPSEGSDDDSAPDDDSGNVNDNNAASESETDESDTSYDPNSDLEEDVPLGWTSEETSSVGTGIGLEDLCDVPVENSGVDTNGENPGVMENSGVGDEIPIAETVETIDEETDDDPIDGPGYWERMENPTVVGGRSLRPNRTPQFRHEIDDSAQHNVHATTVENEGFATPQMPLRKGLKVFGAAGVASVRKEMKQIHDRKVMEPVNAKDLSPSQRAEALAYLMFLKRKRDGILKGRGCADGRPQRAYTNKEDATAPTVAKEAVFLSAAIDAFEGRDVATVDIPGFFLQTDWEGEDVLVRFTGLMVDLLLEVDHDLYAPHVVWEGGKRGGQRVLYVKLLKALYGLVRAAQLAWKKLSSKLKEWGFVANPYDSCVMNKMIKGRQCTVAWHVDDLKLSHKDADVTTSVIDQLSAEFGTEAPLTIRRGTVHDYLGMTFDFSTKGEVTIDHINYLRLVIAEMPPEMEGANATPAANHLFKVDPESPLLDDDRRVTYHRLTMQLHHVSQRARPDILVAVAFLSRHTQNPTEDDWRKLTRVMRYIQATIDLKLRLTPHSLDLLLWWVDAAYAVHPDMRGHSGATMSLGAGSIFSGSTAQKINTRSSTESEVVGVYDYLPNMLWHAHFLAAQRGKDVNTVLHQDNTSAMLLEKNGRGSSTKRTKHMDVRYFYIADCIARGEVSLKHCPTTEMLADFFSKPLQGQLFFKFRALLMNIDPSSKYYMCQRSVLRNPEVADSDPDS